jgi:hypothetical protein
MHPDSTAANKGFYGSLFPHEVKRAILEPGEVHELQYFYATTMAISLDEKKNPVSFEEVL